ncbi:MAG: hypothetical protein JWQ72_412 [Polaromonas sp.]|nr:hypothetical protein [Polaromonas sp.]
MNAKKSTLPASGRTPPVVADNPAQKTEAARYAVIRRLAPCLRHHMVKYLQPISMIYEIIDHRRSAPQPDLPTLYSNADKINSYARAALEQCLDVSTWMAPDADETISLGNGVRECVDLMSASLNFRGYQLVNEVGNVAIHVHRDALRMVLTSAFMAETDALSQPARLVLSLEGSDDRHVVVTLEVQIANTGHSESYEDGYRKIVWRDVEALALAEEVGLQLDGTRLSMTFRAMASGAATH